MRPNRESYWRVSMSSITILSGDVGIVSLHIIAKNV